MSGSRTVSSSSSSPKQANLYCRFLELPPVLILDIFKHLDPRELSVVACVCVLFRLLVSDSHGWKDFYCERWGSPSIKVPAAKEWKQLYGAREGCRSLLGKFRLDRLCGHTETVRAARMLPSHDLVVSAGYDSSVRLWNLSEGLPVACSRPIGDTIRAVAVDAELLAAGTFTVIKVWHGSSACPHLFDLMGTFGGRKTCLRGHSGPITSLGLTSEGLFSGSWDMTIKLWSRSKLKNTMNFPHCDWVHALVPRGRSVLSTAGSDAYSWDVETGSLVRFWNGVHSGQAFAVEGNRTGRFVITGGEDGIVRVFDDRVACAGEDGGCAKESIAAWIPHSDAVTCLAFDDPWLVSASRNGSIALMDLRYVLRKGGSKAAAAAAAAAGLSKRYSVVEGNVVQRMLAGGTGAYYSVDIASDRIVGAGADRFIKVWDFSQAVEIEKNNQASRSLRKLQRLQRKKNSWGSV